MKKTIFLLSIIIELTFSGLALAETNKQKDLVILVHGFGRSDSSMSKFSKYLKEANYEVFRPDYSSYRQNINEIQKEVFAQINKASLDLEQNIHFVGHSLGGLLIRAYLEKNKVPKLGKVVLLGSPNKGTPIVDHWKDKWWFALGGPTAMQLGTNDSTFLSQLKPPYYEVGVIAGLSKQVWVEGVFKQPNDGLVTVESAKLEGMKDFILLNINHSAMRYDRSVAFQTIYFLKHGNFSMRKISNI